MSESKSYCKWCDNMVPSEDIREIVDETEFVLWVGCKLCHVRKLKIDGGLSHGKIS